MRSFVLPFAPVQRYVIKYVPTVAAVLGFVTLAVSYRRHNGSLIKVIRRDGGMYYLSAFCMSKCLDDASVIDVI